MIYLLSGLALACVATIAALAAVGVTPHGDAEFICTLLNETVDVCRASAFNTGVWLVTGYGAALVLTLVILWSRRDKAAPRRAVCLPPLVMIGVVFVSTAIIGAHLWAHWQSDYTIIRWDVLNRAPKIVSALNLLWPILVQLSIIESRVSYKAVLWAMLAMVCAVTPFRAAVLSIVLFAGVLPVLVYALSHPVMTAARRRVVIWGAIGLVASIAATVALTVSQERLPDALAQRLRMPLFQAHLAEEYAKTRALPSASGEFMAKFHSTQEIGLNQYLFEAMYGRTTGHNGQATPLLYGEAAASLSSPPVVWIVAVPLLLMLVLLFTRSMGIECSALIGIAVWRASQGGFANTLPSLVIHLCVIALICRAPALLPPSKDATAKDGYNV